MSKTIGVFGYTVNEMRKPNIDSTSPIVHLCLEHWLDEVVSHAPQVTPELMSATEIDEYVKLLKDDLDSVCHEAKVALVNAKKSMNEVKH